MAKNKLDDKQLLVYLKERKENLKDELTKVKSSLDTLADKKGKKSKKSKSGKLVKAVKAIRKKVTKTIKEAQGKAESLVDRITADTPSAPLKDKAKKAKKKNKVEAKSKKGAADAGTTKVAVVKQVKSSPTKVERSETPVPVKGKTKAVPAVAKAETLKTQNTTSKQVATLKASAKATNMPTTNKKAITASKAPAHTEETLKVAPQKRTRTPRKQAADTTTATVQKAVGIPAKENVATKAKVATKVLPTQPATEVVKNVTKRASKTATKANWDVKIREALTKLRSATKEQLVDHLNAKEPAYGLGNLKRVLAFRINHLVKSGQIKATESPSGTLYAN